MQGWVQSLPFLSMLIHFHQCSYLLIQFHQFSSSSCSKTGQAWRKCFLDASWDTDDLIHFHTIEKNKKIKIYEMKSAKHSKQFADDRWSLGHWWPQFERRQQWMAATSWEVFLFWFDLKHRHINSTKYWFGILKTLLFVQPNKNRNTKLRQLANRMVIKFSARTKNNSRT